MSSSKSLFQIVDKVMKSFINMSESNQIRFKNTVPHQLGQINGNVDLIVFLLVHVIENALKFVVTPGIVEVGANRKSNELELWVRNDGLGIPTEMKELVFDRHFQLRQNAYGAGLGLSMVKRILNYYGGRIWVESEGNKGNVFIVTIPN